MTKRANTFRMLLLAAVCGAVCNPMFTGAVRAADDAAGKTLIPTAAWNCYMPEGIPTPEDGTLVLEAEMKLDNYYKVGKTPFGQREVAVTQEGKMEGPKMKAEILPGGLDFELTVSNGVVEVEQILVLRTSDNKYAIMRNAGMGMDAKDVRVVYDFEVPTNGDFAWLNTGKFVGRRVIDAAGKTMKISIYDVSSVKAQMDAAHTVHLAKPADVPAQSWDYRKAAPGEKQGETIVTESVQLGGSRAVQNGKRGARNIVPITGGTLTGTITGKVLFGGADYQSPGTGPAIDARYLWETTDGEVIVVRNTGPFNGLVPTFETNVDGKFAWLNSGTYLSSPPGMGGMAGGAGRGGPGGAGGFGGLGAGRGAPSATIAPGGGPGAVAGGPGRGPGGAPATAPGGAAAARGGRGGPGGGRGGGMGLSISMYKSSQ